MIQDHKTFLCISKHLRKKENMICERRIAGKILSSMQKSAIGECSIVI